MPKDYLLSIFSLFLLTLLISHSLTAKPVNQPKHASASIIRSNSDALSYLNKYGFNLFENQHRSKMIDGKPVARPKNLKSMLEDFQGAHKLPITGKLDQKTLQLMNTPRGGVRENPLAFTHVTPW